ncbi:MAG: AMP-binding protein [Clostridia bacterium]|nr:AMP-binding protein [Clostridia bacterium]MBQ4602180.1 AMP-binding protein [Clostridia bacterium]
MKHKLYETKSFDSVGEMLNIAKEKAAGHIAFRYRINDMIREVNYAEFCHDVYSLLSALRELGVDGTHIACLSENRYEWINVYLTVLCSRGVFVPVDREMTEDEIINILSHSDSEVIFCSGLYEELIRNNLDRLTGIKYVISFDRTEDEDNFLSFEELRNRGEVLFVNGSEENEEKRTSDSMCMLIYTSGTTGTPKGVMLSENSIISCVSNGLKLCKLEGSCLSLLRYSHAYEAVCGLLGSIHSQVTICINESPRAVNTNFKFYKPTYIYTVPAFLEAIYQRIWQNAEEQGKKARLKSMLAAAKTAKKLKIEAGKGLFVSLHRAFGGALKKIICGGAPLRAEVAEFFEAAGIQVINGYGLTEYSPLVAVNPDSRSDHRTVGIPLPDTEIDIVDPQRDGNGEIYVKGPGIMIGYYKNPDRTAKVITEEGWLITGDRGRIREDGRLVISGRSKDLIVFSNSRIVHPEEIEEHIYKLDYVKEVVVYGIREEGGIRELCAEVYMDPDKQTGDIVEQTEKLRRDITELLSPMPLYKQISQIVIRPQEFPKTTSNKIKRDGLGL